MSTKFLRIISVLIVLVLIISQMYVVKAGLWSDMESDIESFKSTGQEASGKIETDDIVGDFVELAQILMTIGAGVLVAVTIYMGIKYLTGGPEVHSKLKMQLIGLVVSGGVIFGAFVIWRTVLRFSSGL